MSDDEMICHSDTCGRSLNRINPLDHPTCRNWGCPQDDPDCHYCLMCDVHFYCGLRTSPQPCKLCGEFSCDGKYDHGEDCPFKFEGEEE